MNSFFRRLLICFSVVIFVFAFSFSSFALTLTPYRSLLSNDSTALNLYAFYSNTDYYSPLNDYIIIRSSQYDYILIVYIGNNEAVSFTYNNQSGLYSVGSVIPSNQITVINNEYSYLGSVAGSLRSSSITSFQSDYFLFFGILVLIILFLLFLFRSSFNPFTRGRRGYDL